MAVQTSYEINPDRGFPGSLARPTEPHALDSGVMVVPAAATRNPRPGDAVYWDATNNGFAIPTTNAHLLLVCGILSYRKDQVANVDSIVEYVNGEEVEVGVLGTFWVTAGGAVEYYSQLEWQHGDYKWDAKSRVTTIATIVSVPIVCVSRFAGADTEIVQARIGYGRVI